MRVNFKEKLVRLGLAFVLLFSQVLPGPVAFAFFGSFGISNASVVEQEVNMELVTIVVDSALYNSSERYIGLRDKYPDLDEKTFEARVNRYAKDLADTYSGTNVKILEFDSETEGVLELSRALENLYLYGENGSKLIGTVFIGDIPLPVVNKNGNRFISMFPYTDFIDKAYIYEVDTESFIRNPKSLTNKAEIWHGVLSPSEDGVRGLEMLSSYLDKNHLYYLGDSDFADFEKKMFYADFIEEEKNMNSDTYNFYLKYLETLEDSAYSRFTKEWAAELNTQTLSDLNVEGMDINSDVMGQVPDMYTKQIIEQSLTPYYKIFTKYLSQINERVESTGRYSASEVDSDVSLISMKDEFAKNYLKQVNDKVEDKVNEVVDMISTDMPILEYATLSGSVGGVGMKTQLDGGMVVPNQVFRFNYKNEITGETFINGTNVNDLESPYQCSLYMGSSKLVTANRSDNTSTSIPSVSTGVRTKMISPSMAFETVGVKSPGALVEGFFRNFLVGGDDDYKNPLDGKLKKGDLIVSVNGMNIDSSLNYERAIQKVFDELTQVINLLNAKTPDLIDKDLLDKIVKYPGHSLTAGNVKVAVANVPIEFIRDGVKKSTNFTFSSKGGIGSIQDPQGTPAFFLMYTTSGFNVTIDAFDEHSDGAIFSTNIAKENGFNGKGYDLAGGCSKTNTSENPDRCFARAAMMPIKDAGGAIKVDENFALDVDELHMDACYFGLPSTLNLYTDSNPYRFVLDPATFLLNAADESGDFYGQYFKSMGKFLADGNGTKKEVASNISDDFKASEFILNSVGANIVTLKNFSDRWGLFDGVDNDGDGSVDELDESDVSFGIDENNMEEIARKMFSYNREFIVPASVNEFSKELKLKVVPRVLKDIPSVIKHIEPTSETIAAQVNALSALDMPIDDPRYVAFLNEDKKTEKIDYPNLFEISDIDSLKSKLKNLAGKITLIPGSYKVFGPSAVSGSYTTLQIRDEIYENYLLKSISDEYFEMLDDSLNWLSLGIDDKHEYVLEKYLNADENAYVRDSKKGYEYAYLVLDGNTNYFDLNFNKDVLADEASLDTFVSSNNGSNGGAVNSDVVNSLEDTVNSLASGGSGSNYDYVPLDKFMDEINKFINSFTTLPKFEQCCGYANSQKAINQSEELFTETTDANVTTLNSLNISANKTAVSASGSEVELTVESNPGASGLISLNIVGDNEAFVLEDINEKVLVDGAAVYRLKTTGKSGTINVSATSNNGVTSNSITIKSLIKDVRIQTFVVEKAEVDTAVLDKIDEIFINNVVDSGAGDSNGTVDSGTGAGSVTGSSTGGDVVTDGTGSDSGTGNGNDSVTSGGGGEILDEAGSGDGSGSNSGTGGIGGIGGASDGTVDGSNSGNANGGGGANVALNTDGTVKKNLDDILEEAKLLELQEKNLRILSSKNTDVVDGSEIADRVDEKTEDVVVDEVVVEDEIVVEDKSPVRWQEYYIENKYFNLYLEKILSSYAGKLMVELFSDQMITYLPDSQNPFIDYETNPESSYVMDSGSSMRADGESLMKVDIVVFDENGAVENVSGLKVKVSVLDTENVNIVSFENGNVLSVVDGIATSYIRAGTKAGTFTFKAEVIGGNYPSSQTEILLTAGEPAKLKADLDSNTLVANNKSSVNVAVSVYDKFDNLADSTYAEIGFYSDNLVTFENSQVGVFEGVASSRLVAGMEMGSVNVYAYLIDYELTEKLLSVDGDLNKIDFTKHIVLPIKINVIDKANIKVEINSDLEVKAELLDMTNKIIDYNGVINFKSLNTNIASLDQTVNMVNGVVDFGKVKIHSNNLAGDLEISVEVPDYVSTVKKINILAGDPKTIGLSLSDEIIFSDNGKSTTLTAKLFDEFGNLVSNNNSTIINFEVDENFKDIVQLIGNNNVKVNNGTATIEVMGNGKSGKINILAKSYGIETSGITLDVKKRVESSSFKNLSPKTKYITMLGGNFADLSEKDNLANAVLYDGEVQAVSAVSSGMSDENKILAYLNIDGTYELLSETIEAQESDGKIVFTSITDGSELVTLKNNGTNYSFENINNSGRYELINTFSGISSKEKNSYYIVDKDFSLDNIMRAGKSYINGMGFEGDDKNILFFASGNSVGQSQISTENESGIVLGDPMIRLEPVVNYSNSGFDTTIGSQIYNGDSEILKMINLDFDGDEDLDVILLYENGDIRLLENNERNNEFEDRGVLAKLDNGILTGTSIDVNADGFNDLIIGTQESCRVGEVCVTLLTNQNGNFVRQTLNLDIVGKIYEMKNSDLNLDDCEDLVVSDSAGNIRTFYNQKSGNSCLGLNENYSDSWNYGIELDSTKNISNALYANFEGNVVSQNVINLGKNVVEYLQDIAELKNSTKKVTDVNGGNLNEGDRIDYLVTLKNSSSVELKNVIVSDLTSSNMTLDLESLECKEVDCSEIAFESTGMSLRSQIITGLNIPANGQRTIGYSMTVGQMPKVNFDIGRAFSDYPFKDDVYPDIFVKPEVNPGGVKTFLYSLNNSNTKGETNYKEFVEERSDEISTNTNSVNPSEVTAEDLEKVMEDYNKDSDYDGIPDQWDSGKSDGSTFENVVGDVLGFVQNMRCSGGGCLPNPYNYALFAPDATTGNSGVAVLSIEASFPWIHPFSPGASINPSSIFRLYVSPTATMGVGTAVCTGPGSPIGIAVCYVYAIPMDALGLCPDLLGPINDAIVSAKNSIADPDTGMSTVVSDGVVDSDTHSSSFAYDDPDMPFTASGAVNVRIPGFPSVITDWLDNQTDEIFNKLLDLPDLYFIYPQFDSLISDNLTQNADYSKVSLTNLNDVLRAINSVPLIQIETKEIEIKIPAISEAEIIKWKRQAYLWIEYEKNELEKIKLYWQCDISEERKTLCDMVTLKMGEFTLGLEKLLGQLDMIANIPRDILTWRNLEAKYATQIICYLDAIMQYTGGYIKKQTRIIESWMKAIENVIKTFKDWKILLDLSAEYQASCDECKTDRFSKLGILMNLFAVIPEPPIIQFPKWPDIVFDMSQIQAGAKIVWPDVVFKPERIMLPDLPTITLPKTLPELIDITINLEDFGINGLAQLNLPDWMANFPSLVLPHNLPDLPPLPLPQLPDLPRPPEIPKLPNWIAELAANLKPIFKILCLLKKGLIPVPEGSLATEIETLTQPSVTATLPFIMDLGIQMPAIEYNFVEQIKITAKLNFELETNFIYQLVKGSAEIYNRSIKGIVSNANKYTGFPLQQVIDRTVKYAIDEANKAAAKAIESGVNSVTKAVDDTTSQVNDTVKDAQGTANENAKLGYTEDALAEYDDVVNKVVAITEGITEYVNSLETVEYPDQYVLVAEQTMLDPSHPILNRSLEEIELGIKTEELVDTPEMQNLALLRNDLIAYTNNIKKGNEIIGTIDDYNQFGTILAEDSQSLKRIASLSTDISNGNGLQEMKVPLFGAETENMINDLKESTLIAAVPPETSTSTISNTTVSNYVPPKGFFVSINGVTENILSYTRELDGKVNLLYNDVDKDLDTDLIFSLGYDVYLKRNSKNTNVSKQGDLFIGGANSVSDYQNNSAVNGLSTTYVNSKKVDLSWIKISGTSKYEIKFLSSLIDYEPAYTFEILVEELNDPENPSYKFAVENGNYYVSIVAIDELGNRSLPSYPLTVSPSICNDKEPPMPALNKSNYTLYVFEIMEMDASASFDNSGEIAEYYLEDLETGKLIWSDTNVTIDSNGDGNPANDKTNPVFKVGPYTNTNDIGQHKYVLHVKDWSNNDSKQEVTVNVIAPKIILDESFANTLIASGNVDPKLENIPLSLMRKRSVVRVNQGQVINSVKVNKIKSTSSDANGKYEMSDFDIDDMILVLDENDKVVAEINPRTGNVGAVIDGFNVIVNPTTFPASPTTVSIVKDNGNVYAKVTLVADGNVDVSLHYGGHIENLLWQEFEGVHVLDTNILDRYKAYAFGADDKKYPGGVALVDNNTGIQMVIVDTSGNIIVLDKDVSLRLRNNDHSKDPLIYEVVIDGKVIFEIFVSASNNDLNKEIIVGPSDVNFVKLSYPDASKLYGNGTGRISDKFIDVPDDQKFLLENLFKKGLIEYRETPDGIIFNTQEIVSRAEFVRTLLDMLCIIPRPEAYQAYNSSESNGGFSDIYYSEDNLSWYYPYIKEADLLGLIDGYRGEVNSVGLHPFRAEQTITRAEAVKIILEALELKGLINLDGVEVGAPSWYGQFVTAGQNLYPYVNPGKTIPSNFIISSLEALNPDQEMTRGDLITMVYRVLETYNCFEIDSNNNGMSDYCEAKYDISDPNDDPDKDGLKNIDECKMDSNPYNPDSDGGGTNDGDEYKFGTDPSDKNDDPLDRDKDGLTDKEETDIYLTDPLNPDTDDGGILDGAEVNRGTNPLDPCDDFGVCDSGEKYSGKGSEGIYIVPGECSVCPCEVTLVHSAELVEGDIFFTVISNLAEDYFFSKSNEVNIINVKIN